MRDALPLCCRRCLISDSQIYTQNRYTIIIVRRGCDVNVCRAQTKRKTPVVLEWKEASLFDIIESHSVLGVCIVFRKRSGFYFYFVCWSSRNKQLDFEKVRFVWTKCAVGCVCFVFVFVWNVTCCLSLNEGVLAIVNYLNFFCGIFEMDVIMKAS